MNKQLLLIGLMAVTAALTACKSVGPDYQRAKVNLPEKYMESEISNAEAVLNKEWWTYYLDPVLNELEKKALKDNTNIQLAIARIEEADAVAREAGAALIPEVDLGIKGSRIKPTELGAIPTNGKIYNSDFSAVFSTSYEIDFWGKLRRNQESALAQVASSRYAKNTTELSLASMVASTYLQIRSLDAQIAVAQDNQAGRDLIVGDAKRRLAGGIATALDVNQAEASTSSLKAALIELIRLRAVNLHQLAVLTGDLKLVIEPKPVTIELSPPEPPPAGLPSALLENRPDIAQAEQDLIAANAKIGVAKAALYPSISLTGGLGYESMDLANLLNAGARVWNIGAGLYLPIFDSGKLDARVEQVTAKQKQALAIYKNTVQNAFKEVNDALISRRLNAEREVALKATVASSKRALEIAKNRYKAGYSAYLEVLDAQRVQNDAQLALVQSHQATLLATLDLFKALGGGWQRQATLN